MRHINISRWPFDDNNAAKTLNGPRITLSLHILLSLSYLGRYGLPETRHVDIIKAQYIGLLCASAARFMAAGHCITFFCIDAAETRDAHL